MVRVLIVRSKSQNTMSEISEVGFSASRSPLKIGFFLCPVRVHSYNQSYLVVWERVDSFFNSPGLCHDFRKSNFLLCRLVQSWELGPEA
jgi:hypothetical protein